jgi:ATP-dependent protease ClpP protease subunit
MTDGTDIPDADFTPNPDRAIWIRGELNKALEERLEPQIVDLTSRSREPITVFIDSYGGKPVVSQRILALLRSPGENGEPPCRVIYCRGV